MFPGPMFEYVAEWETASRRRGAPPGPVPAAPAPHRAPPPAASRPGAPRAAAGRLGHRLICVAECLRAWSMAATTPRR